MCGNEPVKNSVDNGGWKGCFLSFCTTNLRPSIGLMTVVGSNGQF